MIFNKLTITRIGDKHLGIDGTDYYYNVTTIPYHVVGSYEITNLEDSDINEYFMAHHYEETYQEAGGYFCKDYKFLRINEYDGVLIVHGRYDV